MLNNDTLILITEIKKLNPRLNDFEKQFLQTIEFFANKGFKLSKKQDDCLQKIYCKCVGGGIYQRSKII